MTNEEAREHMDMLIAHKDKALEAHPYFKRCDTCIHSEEQDGSNCYECVKGMADNFEAQQTDTDCISRQAVIEYITANYGFCHNLIDKIKAMPSVIPTNEDISEAYIKGYDYGVKDWFKSKTQPCEDVVSRQAVLDTIGNVPDHNDGMVFEALSHAQRDVALLPLVTPKYTDEEIDKAQAVEQTYIDKMVELAVEETKRPKGKWIEYEVDVAPHPLHCSLCGFSNHHISNRYMREFRRCPNCGAEMEGTE